MSETTKVKYTGARAGKALTDEDLGNLYHLYQIYRQQNQESRQ